MRLAVARKHWPWDLHSQASRSCARREGGLRGALLQQL